MSSDRAATAAPSAPARTAAPVVSVHGVGKCYEIYARPVDRLKQTLYRGRRQFYREFWALRDVGFDLRPGEALGIIGRNGSGKSTLLQIIAGTLRPTTGSVEVRGRVHALLELGSGFNPEFTGRENVYLNGAVLGLSAAQVAERFDEIAAFADIGDFVDQPIKTYSTGMVVRLAFAVQVLMEPDVLIVDEALAVGDAAFQIKCMNRMRRLIERGVAVILVTHDANSVRMFCNRALWLDQGYLVADGPPADVTARYLQFLFGGQSAPADAPAAPASPAAESPPAADAPRTLAALDGRRDLVRWGSGELRVTGFALDNGAGGGALFELGGRLCVEFEVCAQQEVSSDTTGLAFALRNTKGLDIITYTTWEDGQFLAPWRPGERRRTRVVLENILAPGEYALVLAVEDIRGQTRHYYDFVENAAIVRVTAARPVFAVVQPRVRQSWVSGPAAASEAPA